MYRVLCFAQVFTENNNGGRFYITSQNGKNINNTRPHVIVGTPPVTDTLSLGGRVLARKTWRALKQETSDFSQFMDACSGIIV